MAPSPYSTLPDHSFWYRSVSGRSPTGVDPVLNELLRINNTTKLATAGSCFAQHISRHLRNIGIPPYVTERAHPIFHELTQDFQYEVYSARYGNVYTSRQLVQLFDRAYGKFTPIEDFWIGKKGEICDPFRPALPGGFASEREVQFDRRYHLAAVREMFENLDIFVFTLGLTETWQDLRDGAVFPSCPGTIAGVYDAGRFKFLNLSVFDVISDMTAFLERLRSVNPNAKVLLTVSPVSLVASATGDHVLSATVYSKSVLRAAVGQICRDNADVFYFPSYEIITGPQSKGAFFNDDMREVTVDGVAYVMSLFEKHFVQEGTDISQVAHEPENVFAVQQREIQNSLDVVCEEVMNDPSLAQTHLFTPEKSG